MAGQRRAQHAGQRVNIGPRRRQRAQQQLRGDELGRPVARLPAAAEAGRPRAVSLDQDVRRLEGAVRESPRVLALQRGGDLADERDRVAGLQPLARGEHRPQVRAAHPVDRTRPQTRANRAAHGG
jgi:hypothetical protein